MSQLAYDEATADIQRMPLWMTGSWPVKKWGLRHILLLAVFAEALAAAPVGPVNKLDILRATAQCRKRVLPKSHLLNVPDVQRASTG